MALYLVRVVVELEIEADDPTQARQAARALVEHANYYYAEDWRFVRIEGTLPKDAVTVTRKKAGE